jgi:protein-export chaperone SecB
MTENTNPAANGQVNTAPQANVQKIYVKDASFEVPHAPAIFQEQGESQIQLQLNQKVNNFAPNLFEVVLTVTVTCTLGEKTVYLAEVQQAGVFMIANFPQEQIDRRRARHLLPQHAVPVRPFGHLRHGPAGWLPAVPAAADQLRAALCRADAPPRAGTGRPDGHRLSIA